MLRGRYLKSRSRRFRSRQRGFVLPLVMGMGLLMLLVAVTMTFRSQTQNTTAAAQKASERSIAIAEVGVSRMQDFFSRNRGLLRQNFPWAGASGRPLDNLGCTSANATYTEANSLNGAVGVDGGQFQLVSYAAPTSVPGTGTLVLRGDATVGGEVKSQTQLQVKIPISRAVVPAANPPELWAENFTFPASGTQITSNASHQIVEAKCGTLSSLVGAGNRIAAGQVTSSPTRPLPPPLNLPSGTIDLGSYTAPANATTIFPRAADVALHPSGNGSVPNEYVYRAASITVTSTGAIVVPAGSKVTFYVNNNITTTVGTGTGNRRPKIGHDCTDSNSDGISDGATIVSGCSAGDLKIIGMNATAGTFTIANNNNTTPTTTTEAVIIAPNYTVNVGQSSFTTRFKGMIWARTIDTTQGTTTVEPASVAWTTLQPTLPPINPPGSVLPLSMDSFSNWERVNVS